MKHLVFFILYIFFPLSYVLADEVKMTVSAPSAVEVGDKFRVQFVINSQDISAFEYPDFKDFTVLYGPSSSVSNSFQFINGHATQSSSTTYTFTLIANSEGDFSIGSASVEYEGKSIKSKPFSIKVLPSSMPNSSKSQSNNRQQSSNRRDTAVDNNVSDSELFMLVTANKTSVSEQEAILLTYKIYTTVNLTQLNGKLPSLDGFQIQEIDLPRNKEFQLERYKGRNYHTVVWSQYILFPQKSGKLTIPSITYEGIVMQANRNIDPIEAFFSGNSGMIEIRKNIITPELTINVSSLPSKPDFFSGAVGNFNISSTINTQELKANDALSLTLTVNGTGNMKLINTPKIEFPEGFETYDAKVTDNFKLTTNGLTGSKTFEFLAVPRFPGKYIIPPVKFVYFDTNAKTYKTLSTKSYEINVLKGEVDNNHSIADYTGNQQIVKHLNHDIRYIKLGTPKFTQGTGVIFGTVKYWLIYVVVIIIFIIIIFIGRYLINENSNLIKKRGKNANKVALKRLKNAKALLISKKQNEFYDEVLKALLGYVSDKLNMPLEDLNKDNIQNALINKGVDDSLSESFIKLLDECEFAHYAPGDANEMMENVYNDSFNVISRIEDCI